MLLSIDPEGYARCCEALAEWDIREELGKIRAQTLVIAGAEDPSTPPSHGELIASRIRRARFEVLQRAAHLANVERPDEFNELLDQHL
jgi:3-oxoadipate enol-lactonase